ncbi:alpha/beta family hydrolase [Neobacillus niacini]|uniref:alpha/beta family hydrolase n=1 Tax=Neobacillus niacini TaxID=86668 RepID=UPI00398366A7
MYELIENKVIRNDYSTIPYLWIRSKKQNKRICIMLPGLGYTTQRPLFHYATNLLTDNGVDVLHINYHFTKNKHFANLNEAEQEQWMYNDVEAVVSEILNTSNYEQCFLLSKSIGSIPMAMEWKERNFIQNPIGIWLTPLLKEDLVFETLLKTDIPSICIIGNQDHHYIGERVSLLENNSLIRMSVIPNADHSLEVNGDVSATIDAMKVIMKRIDEFINIILGDWEWK